MLNRFRVNNFKSLLNVELRPAGLNVIIGANNAGKTNLCSALRFLALTAVYPLEPAIRTAVGEAWNIPNVYVSDNTVEMEVECSLPHEGDNLTFNYHLQLRARKQRTGGELVLSILKESLAVTGGSFKETPLLENEEGAVKLLHEGRFLGLFKEVADDKYVETTAPTDATMLCRLYDLETNRRANLFKRYLQGWGYYSFSPWALRSPEVVRDTPGLLSDGRNMTRTFFALHNENPRLEKRIIEAVKELEPRLDLLTYFSPDPESVYFFMEDADGNRFSAQSISDGTLRFMAMAYLIVSGVEAGQSKPSSLTVIEEPENGLYVGHLKSLVRAIDPQGKAGQYIFTTHSPYFIDLFDGNLEGLHVIKPGKPSSVLLRPDAEKVRKLLEEMSLGELHYREMLG